MTDLYGTSMEFNAEDSEDYVKELLLTSSSSESSSSEESSSDSESEDEYITSSGSVLDGKMMETILSFSDIDFKEHFHMNRSTVLHIIDLFENIVLSPTMPTVIQAQIGCDKEIYMYLWYLVNRISFHKLGQLFGESKPSAWKVVGRVSAWIVSIGHLYMKWPTVELNQSTNGSSSKSLFESKGTIPDIIGAIGVTHIRIKRPKNNASDYYNKQKSYSIALQAVVNCNNKFTDIFCGEPGSLDDSDVLRRSQLYKDICENEKKLFPDQSFIVGNAEYPVKNWLVPSFKDNGHLTKQQISFNHIHASAKMVAETAFGLLRGRFRRLPHFDEKTHINMVVNIVISACILHNICIEQNDEFDDRADERRKDKDVMGEAGGVDSADAAAMDRRQILLQELIKKNIL